MPLRPYELPHACESAEIAALLGALTPRQRQVLRAYIWQVELGELSITDWLRRDGCPVSARAWYAGGSHARYLHCEAFQAALEAYRTAGQKWQLSEEQRHVSRARSALVRATPKAAERLIEQAEADPSQFWHMQYVWIDPSDLLPSQEILGKRTVRHPLVETAFLTEYLVARPVLDLDKLRDPKHARLIKKFGDSPKNGLSIEFYDAQHAVESILDRADKATASKATTGEESEMTHAANALDAKLAALAERLRAQSDPGQPEPG